MVFSVLLWPFRMLAPIWGLAFISVLTGIFMVWVFGRVSNQAGDRPRPRQDPGESARGPTLST